MLRVAPQNIAARCVGTWLTQFRVCVNKGGKASTLSEPFRNDMMCSFKMRVLDWECSFLVCIFLACTGLWVLYPPNHKKPKACVLMQKASQQSSVC